MSFNLLDSFVWSVNGKYSFPMDLSCYKTCFELRWETLIPPPPILTSSGINLVVRLDGK